jgi:FkbM family methyltransferase
MSLVTYAQMMEDILLHRVFGDTDPHYGFYIDIGAYHPIYHSVTKLFYDKGWRGINIEPSKMQFPSFVSERPRDLNLQIAVSDREGTAEFFEMDQTSTLEQRYLKNSNLNPEKYTVPITTLDRIFEDKVDGEVHFLKIDVEGHETSVIQGWDRRKFRPHLAIVEAFEPNRLDLPTHQEWEHLLLDSGYLYAISDGLNRYYVAEEHQGLLKKLTLPPDDFHKSWDIWRCIEVERQRDLYKKKLDIANMKLLELRQEIIV